MNKYLIVRFSSFGDIAQALPSAHLIRENDPDAEIHWLTRSDFYNFVKCSTAVDRIWAIKKSDGAKGLFQLLKRLHAEKFTHIYDAHNNLRSTLTRFYLKLLKPNLKVVIRSKSRWKRLLLFRFRLNFFPKPYVGALSFLAPLKKWFSTVSFPNSFSLETDSTAMVLPKPFPLHNAIVLAPSATWDLKKWPVSHWQSLIKLLPERYFVILGGDKDTFCQEIAAVAKDRVLNCAGLFSWEQSTQMISLSHIVVSGDTGILHVADVLKKRAIALLGPTAFGFPSQPTTLVAEVDLACRPCTKDGRGHCHNKEYQKCMRDIRPEQVIKLLKLLENK
jgi:ADP-heptose:LPS heptosyltransferase